MRFYKTVLSGIIISISTGTGDTEISEEEYTRIKNLIENSPDPPEGYTYQLHNATLKLQLHELPPLPPADENVPAEDALSELLEAIG